MKPTSDVDFVNHQASWEQVKKDYANNNYDKALAGIKNLERHTIPPELELTKGIIYFYKKELQKAEKILLSEDFSDNSKAQTVLGFIYSEQAKKDSAYKSFRKASSMDSENKLAILGLSIIAFENREENWADNFQKCYSAFSDLPENIKDGRTGGIVSRMKKSIQPNVTITDYKFETDSGMKNKLDIGETCRVHVKIKNENNWLDINELRISLEAGSSRYSSDKTYSIPKSGEAEIDMPEFDVVKRHVNKDGNFIPAKIIVKGDDINQEFPIKVPVSKINISKAEALFIYNGMAKYSGENISVERSSIRLNIRISDQNGFIPDDVHFLLQTNGKKKNRLDKGSYYQPKGNRMAESFTFPDIEVKRLQPGKNVLTVSYRNGNREEQEYTLVITRNKLSYKRVALLIGITRYSWDEDWKPEYVQTDLRTLGAILKEKHGYQVRIIKDISEGQLRDVIKKLVVDNEISFSNHSTVRIEEQDDFIFYFSGHGFCKDPGTRYERGFIIPFGGDKDDATTCYDMNELSNNIKYIKARHKLFILDSCHAGLARISKGFGLPDKCNEYYEKRSGDYILIASDSSERSWINPNLKQSAFTRALTEVLEGAGDNGDGCITMSEIDTYLKSRLKDQHPDVIRISHESGAPSFDVNQ